MYNPTKANNLSYWSLTCYSTQLKAYVMKRKGKNKRDIKRKWEKEARLEFERKRRQNDRALVLKNFADVTTDSGCQC